MVLPGLSTDQVKHPDTNATIADPLYSDINCDFEL